MFGKNYESSYRLQTHYSRQRPFMMIAAMLKIKLKSSWLHHCPHSPHFSIILNLQFLNKSHETEL